MQHAILMIIIAQRIQIIQVHLFLWIVAHAIQIPLGHPLRLIMILNISQSIAVNIAMSGIPVLSVIPIVAIMLISHALALDVILFLR